jgi:hypothetical protein
MNRARFAIVAALAVTAAGTSVLAQNPAPKAPEFKSILAGRKVEQAFKGQADIEFVPSSRKNGDTVVTMLKVKNLSAGPIARLRVQETWFDKGGGIVGGSEGSLEKMLEPGGTDTITIQTPWNAKMNGNSWNFSHANGTVKPRKVAALSEGKAPAGGAKAPAKK